MIYLIICLFLFCIFLWYRHIKVVAYILEQDKIIENLIENNNTYVKVLKSQKQSIENIKKDMKIVTDFIRILKRKKLNDKNN